MEVAECKLIKPEHYYLFIYLFLFNITNLDKDPLVFRFNSLK